MLLESLGMKQLRKLIIFESFDEEYALRIGHIMQRTLSHETSEEMCRASTNLEVLSGSFLVDAQFYFEACEPAMHWLNLTSIALTSRLLNPAGDARAINSMLLASADAAIRIPKLQNLEIWNANRWLATAFQYKLAAGGGCPAVVTWRSTWEFSPSQAVLSAWEDIAIANRATGCLFVNERVNLPANACEMNGIRLLNLQQEVLRPISQQQARIEWAVQNNIDLQ